MGYARLIENTIKCAEYIAKPGKKLAFNPRLNSFENFSCKASYIENNGKKVLSEATKTDIGNASMWGESFLQSQFDAAYCESKSIFGNLNSVENVMGRSKGALSIQTKLERSIQKDAADKTFHSFEDAMSYIKDGIGTRIITKSLPKLSKTQIENRIAEMTIDGEKLTSRQQKLLRDYLYNYDFKNAANKEEGFRLFEQFAQPLIEERSNEVVNQLTLGILQNRINQGSITLEELKKCDLFKEEIITALQKGNIKPIQINTISNYRGKYGLPEFSNNQIRQLSMAMGFKNPDGSKLIIKSDPRGLDYMQYSSETLAKNSADAIKKSGYRTAQMNIVHSNGALGEWQFRGEYTNIIAEYEHIAYDLRQGKSTLGPVFDEYKQAISKLSDKQYEHYNRYLESCYNYYNRLELGLPAVKPKLPKQFNKILEESSLKALHDKNALLEKEAAKGFNKHIRYAA